MLSVDLTPLYPWQMDFMGIDPLTGLPLPHADLIPINMASCGSKSGKGQPLDAVVYTPAGPRRMGDIRVGDTVLTPDGTATVREIHPLGVRELYCVTFRDGSKVYTTEDHLWEVHSQRGKNPKDRHLPWPRILTTKTLCTQGELQRLWVPGITAVDFLPRPVLIDPYVVGVLIGDGGLTGESVKFTSADPEIIHRVREALPDSYKLQRDGRFGYRVALRQSWQRLSVRWITKLRKMGLWGLGSHEKYIPESYKYNTKHVRLQVLRGILDTDGSVDKCGQAVLEQTSKRLADDVHEVIASLGGYCRTTLKRGSYCKNGERILCKMVYRTRIRYPDCSELFFLPRKQKRCRPKRRGLPMKFQSIERLTIRAESQCLTISDARGLYLTDGMIPTHNSAGTATGLILRFLNEQVSCLWSAPVNKQLEPMWRRYMRPVFSKLPKSLVRVQETWGRWSVEIRGTDAALYLMSGEDPDSLRGSSYKYAVIDEAARYPLDSFDSVMTTLTDQAGVLWGISTPKRHGRNQEASWFKREYLDGRRQESSLGSQERRTNRSMQVSTWANPMPAVQSRAAFLRDKYGEDSQFYREEVLGEILESDGSVFRHIVKTHRSVPTPYQEGHSYCYGWDPAIAHDGSPVSIWDIGERREVHLEALPANDWTGQLARLAFLIRGYHISRGRFDASSLGGSVTIQQMREKGIPGMPVAFNQHNKGEYVQAMSLAMEADEPRFLPDETAMREMENYAFTVLPSGIVRYRAAEGKHDDIVSARILAWKELTASGYQVYGEDEAIDGEAAAEIASEHLRDTFTPTDDVESLFRSCGALVA